MPQYASVWWYLDFQADQADPIEIPMIPPSSRWFSCLGAPNALWPSGGVCSGIPNTCAARKTRCLTSYMCPTLWLSLVKIEPHMMISYHHQQHLWSHTRLHFVVTWLHSLQMPWCENRQPVRVKSFRKWFGTNSKTSWYEQHSNDALDVLFSLWNFHPLPIPLM